MNGMLTNLGQVPSQILASLSPIAKGRMVLVWQADLDLCRAALPDAEDVVEAGVGRCKPGALLLCTAPAKAAAFLSSADLSSALAHGLIIAVWSTSFLRQLPSVPHVAHYLHRSVSGVLLHDAQLGPSHVAVLHAPLAAPRPELHLWLLSTEPFPLLRPGLYEDGAVLAAPPLLRMEPGPSYSADKRAIALSARLLEVEDRTMQLRARILQPESNMAAGGSATASSGFEPLRTRHPWPLTEAQTLPIPPSAYDCRPDDAVLVEARRGAAFMGAYGLNGDTPDFVGAVAALNNTERVLRLDIERPDMSIVIPAYGQLPYTLNCLDSLLRHNSRFTAEIIVLDDCSPDHVTEQFIPQVAGIRYHRQLVNGGFIRSCNTGGDLARGSYVLMLNSDTRVVEHWLDEIIETFAIFPQAGLVGSKMLYADGTLQEAGGILWRDGSAWNYGRDDDPNRPHYCFARQVDYVSGCSIALPSQLWRELGGFDPFYSPAYAEDADLCQRVRACGLEVWFQPTSRVVHYEGKTSGTSTVSGVKAYQVINLRKLFLRWQRQFERHRRNGEASYLEKERDVRKRILFVDAVTPTPDQDAGSVQTVLGLRCARNAGFKVCFVPEDNWLFEPAYTPRLQREGIECAYAPFDVGFDNYIRRYGWLYDAVIVYRVHVMDKCLTLLREYAPDAVVLFHVADLHFLRLQRQAELEEDAELAQTAAALKEKELDIVRRSDCTITHSSTEADILFEEAADAPVTIWPLMMEVVGTNSGFDARRDICFLGGYRHSPNVDAVVWFVREILPLIHDARPELRFIVAGANPTSEVLELANERVVVTGMVAHLADVFDKTRVFVCPLRIGAGAKGKVVSALAHGLPIVSSAIGVEGAGLVEGEHVLVAEGPAAFARDVLRLYDDPVLWSHLSRSGLQLIQDQFSLGMGVTKLEEALEKAQRKRLGLIGV